MSLEIHKLRRLATAPLGSLYPLHRHLLPNGTLVAGRYEARFRVYDIVKQAPLGAIAYLFTKENSRAAAHRIADFVYEKLLGEPADGDQERGTRGVATATPSARAPGSASLRPPTRDARSRIATRSRPGRPSRAT